MNRVSSKQVREKVANSGGDYHVFVEIRDTIGNTISAFEGPATKAWTKIDAAYRKQLQEELQKAHSQR